MRGDHHVLHHLWGSKFELEIGTPRSLSNAAESLTELCASVEDRTEQTIVVIRLAPRTATTSWPGEVRTEDVNHWERALRRFERLSAITIAVAEGSCGGSALDILVASDYRIGSGDLRLLLPVNMGQFWPGMTLYRLVQQIGSSRTRQLVLWGHDLSAERAMETGLIDEVMNDLTDEAIEDVAGQLGRQPGHEVAIRRSLILEAASTTFEAALGSHLAACDRELRRLRSGTTADFKSDG